MKSALISIKPKYCELIANGKKTIEVRKTKPKLETPFKCYIYCTKPKPLLALYNKELFSAFEEEFDYYNKNTVIKVNGKVVGEFVCDRIIPISITYSDPDSRVALKEFPYTCLTDKQIIDYLGNGKTGYGWYISDLKIYDKPKELYEFEKPCPYDKECWKCKYHYDGSFYEPPCCNWEDFEISRPPQSWCYVEELRE